MKDKIVSAYTSLKSKVREAFAWVVSLKRFFTLKNLTWFVPTMIIVVGLVVLFTVPVQKSDDAVSDENASENEQASAQVATSLTGLYESGLLPAASTPGREFTLALAEDGTATFVGDYKTGDRLVDELGTWTLDNNRVTLTLTKRFGHDLATPMIYVFEVNDNTLTLVDYDLSRWGYMGLNLIRL